jgi:hypothetical protein
VNDVLTLGMPGVDFADKGIVLRARRPTPRGVKYGVFINTVIDFRRRPHGPRW